MRNLFILIMGSLLLLSGCSDSNAMPSEKELKEKLQKRLTKVISVDDLEISAFDNIGTKVDPKMKIRFVTELSLNKNLYKVVKRIQRKSVLELTAEKGSEMKGFGMALSTLKLDEWKTKFTDFKAKPDYAGYPLEHFRKGSYIFKGSKEENELNTKDKAEKEKWKKQAAEDAKRQKIKAEKKRKADAIKYKRQNDKLVKLISKKRTLKGNYKNKYKSYDFKLYLQPVNNSFIGTLDYVKKHERTRKPLKARHIPSKQMLVIEFKGYKIFMNVKLNDSEDKLVGQFWEAQNRYNITIDI